MINLKETQVEEIQALLNSDKTDEALLKEFQSKAQADLKAGKTHLARQLLYYYGASFGITMAMELKTVFNEQEQEIKADMTLTQHEQRSRIDKLRTSYAEDCFKFAAEFKKEYDQLGASIVETARKQLAKPAAPINDPHLETEFKRELQSFNNSLFISRNAKSNADKMNVLIKKYSHIPQFATQLSDSFGVYSQATTQANGGREGEVLSIMQTQLKRIESNMFTQDQLEAKEHLEAVAGYENIKLFSQSHIDAIGNLIGKRYANLLNDVEKGQGVLEADKQAYIEKEQQQMGVRSFGFAHTAAHDIEGGI